MRSFISQISLQPLFPLRCTLAQSSLMTTSTPNMSFESWEKRSLINDNLTHCKIATLILCSIPWRKDPPWHSVLPILANTPPQTLEEGPAHGAQGTVLRTAWIKIVYLNTYLLTFSVRQFLVIYRVTHQVGPSLSLTWTQKLRFSINACTEMQLLFSCQP